MERKKTISGAAYQQEHCANYISQLYEAEDFQTQQLKYEGGTIVQVRNTSTGLKSAAKRWTGLEVCAVLKLISVGDDLEISVEAGKWIDKVTLSVIGMFLAGGVLVITSGIGAWRQSKLLDRVYIDALSFFSGAK